MPILTGEFARDKFEQLTIESGGVTEGQRFAVKPDIVGMDIEQDHPAMMRDPPNLFCPTSDIALAQDQEEGGILRQGVGELDVAGAEWSGGVMECWSAGDCGLRTVDGGRS